MNHHLLNRYEIVTEILNDNSQAQPTILYSAFEPATERHTEKLILNGNWFGRIGSLLALEICEFENEPLSLALLNAYSVLDATRAYLLIMAHFPHLRTKENLVFLEGEIYEPVT